MTETAYAIALWEDDLPDDRTGAMLSIEGASPGALAALDADRATLSVRLLRQPSEPTVEAGPSEAGVPLPVDKATHVAALLREDERTRSVATR